MDATNNWGKQLGKTIKNTPITQIANQRSENKEHHVTYFPCQYTDTENSVFTDLHFSHFTATCAQGLNVTIKFWEHCPRTMMKKIHCVLSALGYIGQS